MGVGDSLEASYPLRAPVPAGIYRIVGDGIVAGEGAQRIEVAFELLLRRQGTPRGGGEHIVRLVHTFVRDLQARFSAVRYEGSAAGPEVAAAPGDLLVLRVTALGGDPTAFYILNGDGARTGGRIPRIDLPR